MTEVTITLAGNQREAIQPFRPQCLSAIALQHVLTENVRPLLHNRCITNSVKNQESAAGRWSCSFSSDNTADDDTGDGDDYWQDGGGPYGLK